MVDKEGAAIVLLKRAVEMDASRRYRDALFYYKEGLNELMEVMKECRDKQKKAGLRKKVGEYLERTEKLQAIVNKEKEDGKLHEHYKIESGSTGHSYESIFGDSLDGSVSEVHVEDPYIRYHHQVVNFLRFCELLVRKCPNLKAVRLVTTYDDKNRAEQTAKLAEIGQSLGKRGVALDISYSDTLHDREVRLDSGWVVKIGRGLDIYKPPEGKMSLGSFDLDLRERRNVKGFRPPEYDMGTEETPRQKLFALCWRGGPGALDKIKDLIDSKEVKVNDVDQNNVTALRFAAQYDHEEIVRYLLAQGASTKIKAHDGMDPLLAAIDKRHVGIVSILLEHGANPNTKGKDTYALKLARDNLHQEMEEVLVAAGAVEQKPLIDFKKKGCSVS